MSECAGACVRGWVAGWVVLNGWAGGWWVREWMDGWVGDWWVAGWDGGCMSAWVGEWVQRWVGGGVGARASVWAGGVGGSMCRRMNAGGSGGRWVRGCLVRCVVGCVDG